MPIAASVVDVYRARWVVPVTAPPIAGGELAVRDGRIVSVGPAGTYLRQGRAGGPGWSHEELRSHDLGDVMLLPGFINAHAHLELTCYRGRVPSAPLFDWFDRLVSLRLTADTDERERRGLVDGADESLVSGVTCTADISRTGMSASALAGHPMRRVCFVELISGGYRPPNDAQSLEAVLAGLERHAADRRLRLGVSPHTPYTVTIEDLRQVASLARRRGLPMTLHALETPDEAAWIEGGGGRVAAFLASRGLPTAGQRFDATLMASLKHMRLLDRHMLLAHVNYPTPDDLDALAAGSASVVWCPRAHAFFGHGPHPFRSMQAMGVNVCIGTDSAACDVSLSILDELRFLRRRHPDLASGSLLAMGTINAAIGLGLDSEIGSLAVGKQADFVCVPWRDAGGADPIAQLWADDSRVSDIWIEGRREVKDGAVLRGA